MSTLKRWYTDIDVRKRATILAMNDVVTFSTIALPIIMLFEAYMIGNWIANFKHSLAISSIGYLIGYAGLFIASALVWAYIIYARNRVEEKCSNLLLTQDLYGVLIFIWAVFFTYMDATYRDSFSIIIYVTIITIVPIFCFLSPYLWAALEILATVQIFFLASHEPHFTGFVINFSVFTIIAIVAEFALYRTRISMYVRQYDLEKLRERDHFLAYYDILTGLKNRRSYTEELDAIEDNRDLLLASFDINGLKAANDTMGHEAGDELISNAGAILYECFNEFGSVYRTGGDEFAAILHIDKPHFEIALLNLENIVNKWHGEFCDKISISAGYVFKSEFSDKDVTELIKIADKRMYEDKSNYYQRTGNDRRRR